MFRTATAAAALLLIATPALALGPESFSARTVEVEGVLGTLDVTVDPAATQVTVEVTGPSEWLNEVTLSQKGDHVVIEQEDRPNRIRTKDREDWLAVRIAVPAGTGLTVEDYIGEGRIGDLNGLLTIDGMNAGKLEVGNVTALQVEIDGSGDVTVGTSDTAAISISGSGDVTAGDVRGDLSVDISGSGDVRTGTTNGKVDLDIAGSGNITVARVTGPVNAGIAGSGDIKIGAGTADPLAISIAGSGGFTLDGIARSQSISQSGSGNVKITGRQS